MTATVGKVIDPQERLSGGVVSAASEMGNDRSPVFILSPAPRCGTNFLAHALELHPSFRLPAPIWEDYVLGHAHLLDEYAARTASRWGGNMTRSGDYRAELMSCLGAGVLAFLGEHADREKRILCKTPRSYHIELFPRLFPGARMLLLIRDGRDVVDSAVRTWPNRLFAFVRSTWTWARGADRVLAFMEGTGRELRDVSWMLVRYEELVESPESVVKEILLFLDANTDEVDMREIAKLPLWGSSVHHGGGGTDWEPVQKPQDFRPIGRWRSWGWRRRMLFKIIAGRELVHLGYAANRQW